MQTSHRLKLNLPEQAQKKKTLLELWEINARDRINKNHEDLQALLEMKLRHLEEEEALVLKALERYPKEGESYG